MTWMKFRCDQCGEVYWVDDAKITDQGAKTKCIKCQNVISVKKRPRPTPLKPKEKRKTVSCPHCQYENPEGTQFCTMCQKPLVEFKPKPKPQQQAPSEAAPKKEVSTEKPSPEPSLDLSSIPPMTKNQA